MSSHSDWRRLGRSLVQPCSQSRVSTEFTPGHLGFSLIRSFRTSNSLVLWDPFFPSFISVMRLCFPPPCISSGNLPCFSLSLCLMICISLKKLSFFNTFQCVKASWGCFCPAWSPVPLSSAPQSTWGLHFSPWPFLWSSIGFTEVH